MLKFKNILLLFLIVFLFAQCKQEPIINYEFDIELQNQQMQNSIINSLYGDTVELTLSVKSNYDLQKIPIEFAFIQGSLKGKILLNGVVLQENRYYKLDSLHSTIKFIPSENEGQYQLQFDFTNNHFTKRKAIYVNILNYSFDITLTEPNNIMYQGIEYEYQLSLKSNYSIPSEYYLMPSTYKGELKINGENCNIGENFAIASNSRSITNVTIGLKKANFGNDTLNLVVKANNIEKQVRIIQSVNQNQITLTATSTPATVVGGNEILVLLGTTVSFSCQMTKFPHLSNNFEYSINNAEWHSTTNNTFTYEITVTRTNIGVPVVFKCKDEFGNLSNEVFFGIYAIDL